MARVNSTMLIKLTYTSIKDRFAQDQITWSKTQELHTDLHINCEQVAHNLIHFECDRDLDLSLLKLSSDPRYSLSVLDKMPSF